MRYRNHLTPLITTELREYQPSTRMCQTEQDAGGSRSTITPAVGFDSFRASKPAQSDVDAINAGAE